MPKANLICLFSIYIAATKIFYLKEEMIKIAIFAAIIKPFHVSSLIQHLNLLIIHIDRETTIVGVTLI